MLNFVGMYVETKETFGKLAVNKYLPMKRLLKVFHCVNFVSCECLGS